MKKFVCLFSLVPGFIFCDLESVKRQIDIDLKQSMIEISQLDNDDPQGWHAIGKAEGLFHCLLLIEQDLLK